MRSSNPEKLRIDLYFKRNYQAVFKNVDEAWIQDGFYHITDWTTGEIRRFALDTIEEIYEQGRATH